MKEICLKKIEKTERLLERLLESEENSENKECCRIALFGLSLVKLGVLKNK